jgi:hypothetical protein
MPNKTEVWQRIISHCDNPSELVVASKYINKVAQLESTKAMWILQHPHSLLSQQLVNQRIMVMLLHSGCDYYNQSPFLDLETENVLSDLLLMGDKHFITSLQCYHPTHSLQKLVHFVSILIQHAQPKIECFDSLLQWSNNEFNGKLIHLCLKASKPLYVQHLLSKEGMVDQIDWHDITETHFLELLHILKSNDMLDIESNLVSSDLVETIITRDLSSCLEFLIQSGLVLEEGWQLHLAVIKNSVKCVIMLLEHGLDPHIDNDICILDAARHGYTRLVHLLSKTADKHLLQETLMSAIEGDQPEVVALLLEMPNSTVKCNQHAFYLATRKKGTKREASRQLTVLELLLASSSDVFYLSYVGKSAVKMVSDYCKQVFTNIATK